MFYNQARATSLTGKFSVFLTKTITALRPLLAHYTTSRLLVLLCFLLIVVFSYRLSGDEPDHLLVEKDKLKVRRKSVKKTPKTMERGRRSPIRGNKIGVGRPGAGHTFDDRMERRELRRLIEEKERQEMVREARDARAATRGRKTKRGGK